MENKITLNISMISSVLKVNYIDIKTLRENEEKNNYYKTLPNYSPLLLQIACDFNKEFSEEISLNAAIQLKNYINLYWKNKPNKNINKDDILINEEDKQYLKIKILDAVIFIIEKDNIKILKQFNQCVKKILKYDFKEKNIEYNKDFMNKVVFCLNSNNLKQIYAGIILFYQLSKIFEFDNEENQKIYDIELNKVNNYLLSSLYKCEDINNSLQAQFAYKILKIFFGSFQGAIPELFTKEEIFSKWVNFIINTIKNPISQNNIDNNKKNIFLKLKRVCYQTITRIIQKSSRYTTNVEKSPFENMISNKYIPIFFDIYKNIFTNCFNNKLFIDDYGKTCIYIFFSILIENKNYNKNVLNIFINDKNNELLNYIINDCFMTYEDLELWSNDPKKYLSEKVEEINSILTKRYNSRTLFSSIFSYKVDKKSNPIYCQTLFEFLCKCLINENEKLNIEKKNLLNNNKPYHLIYNEIYFCLRKESILYLLQNNNNIKELLKGNIQILLQIYLKLMEETDLEEIMSSLQEIVNNFTEESKIYIVELSEYLIKYFNKLVTDINDDEENQIDDFSLINNIIKTFCNFCHYFTSNENIYPKIEKHIDILLNFCIVINPYDKLEEGTNLLEEILTNSKIVPKHIWKFFIPLIQTVIGDELETNINNNNNNIINNINNNQFDECGYENIMSINRLLCYYISKDDGLFINLKDEKGNQYLIYIINYIKYIINICDKNEEYLDYIYIFEIFNTLLNKYKNNVGIIVETILNIILQKYNNTKNNEKLANYLCLLLSTCFIYFPTECLKFFQNNNKLKYILMFLFFELDKIKIFKQIKYNLFGICSLISLDKNNQDKLIIDNIKLFIDKILKLVDKIVDKNQKEEKKNEKNKEEKNNINDNDNDNDDDLDDDELFKKFLEGKEIKDDEDEDWEEEEEEEEDDIITEIDKQNPILIVKNTFDLINKQFPELFKMIIDILGTTNSNKLNEIFIKEEQRLKK